MTTATKHITRPGGNTGAAAVHPHITMVKQLAKAGELIANDLNDDFDKGNALLGSARDLIEAGNNLDLVKKWAVYSKQPEGMVFPCAEGEFAGITAEQAHLLHMAIGIAGEAAELLEAVVKHIDGEDLDVINCVEESGDIEFYHEGFRQGLGVHREHILQVNIAKLGKRYEGHNYSDAQAQDRADKA